MIELKTKVRGDLEQELKFIESITEPKSIYPKILELPNRGKRSSKYRARYDPGADEFAIFGEEYR